MRPGGVARFSKSRLLQMDPRDALATVVERTGVTTQPCIHPGSLNRVPASAGVRAGMSPLPGGRKHCTCDPMWHVSSRSGVAGNLANCYTLDTYLLTYDTCNDQLDVVAEFFQVQSFGRSSGWKYRLALFWGQPNI